MLIPSLVPFYLTRGGHTDSPLMPYLKGDQANVRQFLNAHLATRDYVAGAFSAADIGLVMMLDLAFARGELNDYPNILAYLERLHARPAYQKAMSKMA